jgi:threonine dehydratase
MPDSVTLDDIRAARERIGGRLSRTPVFSSRTLGERVFLKAELFQPTGSFKVRGVLSKLATLSPEQRARGVIGISAGNHAQALAWGAREEGVDALLVMWRGASEQKLAATLGYGAHVDLEADSPATAFERLHELIAESGRTLVHPFDDPVVIAGAGTCGLELVEDVPDVDTVLVACGGGGLVSGIAVAVKALRPEARVLAVEPEGSTALHSGLAAGHSVPVHPVSIADGLSAPFAGEHPIALCSALGVESVLVSEEEIEAAFRFLYLRAKLACEPAAAAALAPLLAGRVDGGTTAVVVSGGNVSARTASDILARA